MFLTSPYIDQAIALRIPVSGNGECYGDISPIEYSSVEHKPTSSVPQHTQPSFLAKPFRRTEEQSLSCVSADLECRPPHGLHLPAPERACRVASPVRESVSAEVILASSPCTDIRLPLLGGPTHMLLPGFSRSTSSNQWDSGCTPTCLWSASPAAWPYTAWRTGIAARLLRRI